MARRDPLPPDTEMIAPELPSGDIGLGAPVGGPVAAVAPAPMTAESLEASARPVLNKTKFLQKYPRPSNVCANPEAQPVGRIA